jgi:hypothetical protein
MGYVIATLLTIQFIFSMVFFLQAMNYLREVRIVRKDISEFRQSLIQIVAQRKRRF